VTNMAKLKNYSVNFPRIKYEDRGNGIVMET